MKTGVHAKPAANLPVELPQNLAQSIFAGLFGALLGLAMLKFGNPVILEKYVTWPTNIYEWVLTGWPLVISYWLLAGVALAGLMVARWKTNLPRSLVVLPVAWLVWEVVA